MLKEAIYFKGKIRDSYSFAIGSIPIIAKYVWVGKGWNAIGVVWGPL